MKSGRLAIVYMKCYLCTKHNETGAYAPYLPLDFCPALDAFTSSFTDIPSPSNGLLLPTSTASRVLQILTKESRVLASVVRDLSAHKSAVDSLLQELQWLVFSTFASIPPS
ncbi:hypothetical protein E5676_scaffold232G001120 [Cucumis melo var. makuwa]|uniref:Flocculation protein FLO11-like n=1 Tax=Cucumis melo var. makuwa TaxID=1194695 RepID=A0A5D3BJ30_CUCMM|nr:hypothetical protein E5676_scaffold232G001120 [Cucumis melo var. makuwa]